MSGVGGHAVWAGWAAGWVATLTASGSGVHPALESGGDTADEVPGGSGGPWMSVWMLVIMYACVYVVALRALTTGVRRSRWILRAKLGTALALLALLAVHLLQIVSMIDPELPASLGLDGAMLRHLVLIVPLVTLLVFVPSIAVLSAASRREKHYTEASRSMAACIHRVAQAETLCKLVMDSSIGATFVMAPKQNAPGREDRSGLTLLASNRAFDVLMGIARSPHERDGSDPTGTADIARWVEQTAQAALNSSVAVRSERAFLRHNQDRWYWLSVACQGQHVAGTIVETTNQRMQHAEHAQSANTDPLTRLANRRRLNDIIDVETHRARHRASPGFTALFFDFDRFKEINDTMGHDVGDELLRQIASRLRDTVGRSPLLAGLPRPTLARYGGDEFVAVLPSLIDPAEVDGLALAFLDAFRVPYEIFGKRVLSTASIGAAICTGEYDSGATVLKAADEAMYLAKKAGKDRCHVYRSLGEARRGAA